MMSRLVSSSPFLIVGLGNPGPRYQFTRHNVGFMALDFFVEGGRPQEMGSQRLIFSKPQDYMNRSGQKVQELLHFHKIPLDHLLVLHDDVDQPLGQFRFHRNRGHGGHNGVRDIIEKLGTQDFTRIKIGIGRPHHPDFQVADYVLGRFSDEELELLKGVLNEVSEAIQTWIQEGPTLAFNKYNSPKGDLRRLRG